MWSRAQQGDLDKDLEALFETFLKPGSKVLEAGCGLGQVVLALRQRGHDCWGLDYAQETIELLSKEFPGLPFFQGDIRALPFGNAVFDAYISLGVIEHFISGQEEILREAARVIKSGGHILVTVPAMNGFRRLRMRCRSYQGKANAPFFEACYSLAEVNELLVECGFIPIGHRYQNPVMTFVQETPIRPIYRHVENLRVRYIRGAIERVLRLFLYRPWFGHMLMVVARRA